MTFTLSSLLRNRLLRSLAALSLLASLASGCAATSQPAQQSRHQGYRPPMATASGQDAEEAYPGYPSQQSGGGYPGGNPGVYPMPTSAPPPAPGKAESRSAGASIPKDYDKRAPEPNRPGLATHWGENRYSPISTTSFNRANWDSPMSVGTLWYNDREGARASASVEGYRSTTRAGIEIASGGVTISVRDENGAMLPGYSAGGKTFAIGEAGRRYTLVITNNTPARFEIVTSVDGLDVLDGTAASYTKRGYIVRPNSTLEIEGFRRSDQTVAAFRFGDVRGSYAGKKGDDRNVGVIGIAVFHEQGTPPWPWGPSEIDRRRQADPFPGRYAEPPPLS